MPLTFVPFEDAMLEQAADMLAQQHRRYRATMPALPARFEQPEHAARAITAARGRNKSQGFAAFDGNRMVAYVIGDILIAELWGRTGWVRMPGCAYDEKYGPEPVRDLYAMLGARWVQQGIFTHFARISALDAPLVHAWFSMAFGIEQVHAVLDLETIPTTPPPMPDNVTVRPLTADDRDVLANMSDTIWRQLTQAPTWAIQVPENAAETREGWRELADEEDYKVWLAFHNDKLVAMQGYVPADAGDEDMSVPDNSAELGVAATLPAARGLGIGRVMTHNTLTKAREAGFRYSETDWRSANLLASRFWPNRGYKPVLYRLSRRIDQRIAWATRDGLE